MYCPVWVCCPALVLVSSVGCSALPWFREILVKLRLSIMGTQALNRIGMLEAPDTAYLTAAQA